jgi:betaine reductase
MDLELQKRIKELADKNKQEKPIMIIGSADAEGASIVAETVSIGDPSYAGPLTGVQLGLLVYHIVEPEVKREIDSQLYEEKIAIMEMVLDVENIIKEMEKIRAKGSG